MKRVPSTSGPRILIVCLLFFAPLVGGACSSANVAASGTGSGGTGGGGGGGSIIGPLTDGGSSPGSGSPMACDVANYGVMFTKGECPHDCSGQASNTYISGKVYDPAGLRTIYGAVVYIPSNPSQVVDPMPFAGVQCTTCANFTYAGPPVPQAHAVTAPDGSFKIGIDPSTGTDWAGGNPVPVGNDIPLVIQIGKWRRMVTIAVAACQDNQVDKSLTSLPSSRGPDGQNGRGSLPRIAISVGDADRLQCLFARMGIAGSEFTSGPTGTGAINLYKDDTADFTGPVAAAGTRWLSGCACARRSAKPLTLPFALPGRRLLLPRDLPDRIVDAIEQLHPRRRARAAGAWAEECGTEVYADVAYLHKVVEGATAGSGPEPSRRAPGSGWR